MLSAGPHEQYPNRERGNRDRVERAMRCKALDGEAPETGGAHRDADDEDDKPAR